MILFASGRTDIPAFYSEWFMNRLRAGFVDVRNPYYGQQVTRYKLTPDVTGHNSQYMPDVPGTVEYHQISEGLL